MKFLKFKIPIVHLQTIFLICIGVLYLWFGIPSLYKRISWCDGYALGDWLINYEDGGFKRRGLSGTTFIFLSKLTDIYVGKIVFLFITFLYIIFICLFINYFRKIRFDFWLLLFTLLPTVFLFQINDLYAFGRKEILLFTFYLFFLNSYNKIDVFSWRFVILISLIIFIITLFHELVVFYIPYLIIIYLKDFCFLKKGSLIKILVVALSSFLPALFIFLFGADLNEGGTWTILKPLGVSHEVMNGIFACPKEGFVKGKVNALLFAYQHNYYLYIISYLISFFVFMQLVLNNYFFKLDSKKILGFQTFLLFISFPIFYLTIDWGRWFNIHFMCMLFTISLFLPRLNNSDFFSIEILKSYLSKISNNIKIGLFLVVVFGFTMRHVDIGFEYGPNNVLKQIRDLIWIIRN